MNGIVNGILVFVGLRPSGARRRPSARRATPVQAPRRPDAPTQPRRQVPRAPARGASAGPAPDAIFGEIPRAAPAPAPSRLVPRMGPPRRSARVGGFGMLFLAGSIVSGGAWIGSEVQALALGMHNQRQVISDMTAMTSVPADKATGFTF